MADSPVPSALDLHGGPGLPEGFDFTDPELYVDGVPRAEFARLRRVAPVWWNSQPHGSAGFDDDGYWVVTRHADVMEVSRDSHTYSSWENTAMWRIPAAGGSKFARSSLRFRPFAPPSNRATSMPPPVSG